MACKGLQISFKGEAGGKEVNRTNKAANVRTYSARKRAGLSPDTLLII